MVSFKENSTEVLKSLFRLGQEPENKNYFSPKDFDPGRTVFFFFFSWLRSIVTFLN